MFSWILLLVPFVLIYYYFKHANKYWESRKVPYAKPWLFFGNMGKFVLQKESMEDMVEKLYNSTNTRYLGIFQFLTPTLFVKDLNLIKQITIKAFDHFADHRTFITEETDPLLGKNLFSLKGDKWRNMRSTLSPAFTGSKMRALFLLISDCGEQYTKYFQEKIKPSETLTLELKDTFSRFSNDVIASTAFGIQCDSMRDQKNEFYLMGKELINFDGIQGFKFFGFNISPALMKFFKVRFLGNRFNNYFRGIICDNIKSREEQGIVRQDMIHLLMEARKGKLKHEDTKNKDEAAGFATVEESDIGKQDNGKQQELTDDDITAQAVLFFFAGFDSVSASLCHVIYELAINEDIQERLQKEIVETLEECGGKITYEALIKMKYLDMVVSEGLRKWPAGPFQDRICTEEFTIQPELPGEVPLTLNKNDCIWLPTYGIQRDPKYFPNPLKFDPERFSDENKGNINPCSYFPFGIGPRNCIASRFALLEMKVFMLHMLSRLRFVLVEKSEVPIKTSRSSQFSMNAHNGFWVGLKLRK